MTSYKYVIVGAGVAGTSAVRGIREWDPAPILLMGAEPPPSVRLALPDPDELWRRDRVDLRLDTRVVAIDPQRRRVTDSRGRTHGYGKLLLAGGGRPRRLEVPGAELARVVHDRGSLDASAHAEEGSSVLIVGGGLRAVELAAALAKGGREVTLLVEERSLAAHRLPRRLARLLTTRCADHGIRVVIGDRPLRILREANRLTTTTQGGARLDAQAILVALGITPSIELAERAGLRVGDGIVVDEYLRTSNPDIFVAGDNALFPSLILEEPRRLERSENAQLQGKLAGENMTGRRERYEELPRLSARLFDLELEGVGELSAARDTLLDWNEAERSGAVFYLRRGQVRGVLLVNRPGKLEAARQMILRSVPGDDEHDPRLWL